MDLSAFQRKVGQLRVFVAEEKAISNVPHGVSDAARRAVTREYRRDLVSRINSFYADNAAARAGALQRLRESDIDHILDLQLNGLNVRRNLKELHSFTNQRLGSQIGGQLPAGQRVKIVEIEVVVE